MGAMGESSIPGPDGKAAAAERVSARVRRLLAPNPGPFTYEGTQSYIVGEGQVAVIDPGPAEEAHLAALLEALRGERLTHIVITHTHRDHSPAAAPLARLTGAEIVGCAPVTGTGEQAQAFDPTYAPHRVMSDGDRVSGPDWTLTAVTTPGHTSNHVCFALEEEQALFSGDHVMGWSTTVISPPDGSVAAYMASLEKLLARSDRVYYPAHGPAVTEPQRLVRGLAAHRKVREGQIVRQLQDGPKTIQALVAALYASIAPELHAAAGRSVHAHLIDLELRGRVARSDDSWRLLA
jgi:glyoxylase-like metal-dependent hydrolase (beta-lactamase superfamily II)